jgi:hypothetical protein
VVGRQALTAKPALTAALSKKEREPDALTPALSQREREVDRRETIARGRPPTFIGRSGFEFAPAIGTRIEMALECRQFAGAQTIGEKSLDRLVIARFRFLPQIHSVIP